MSSCARGLGFTDLGYVRPAAHWTGITLTVAFLDFAGVLIVFELFPEFLGLGAPEEWSTIDRTTGLVEFATLLLYVGVLGPIAEELAFRGLLFRWLRQRLSLWPAAFVSALLFGLLHEPWIGQMISAGAGGLIYAWLFERSRSLVPPILAHQAYNVLIYSYSFVDARLFS